MNGEKRGNGSPPLGTAEYPRALLSDRTEISGRTIVGQVFVGLSANRAVIADTLFRDCDFSDCSFRTADMEAVAFENCRFSRCDFSTADFRSAEFARCRIESCDFSGGAIKASHFMDTRIAGGKFGRQALDENSWVNCELVGVNFRRATLLHMTFERCKFVATQFADCTSLYHFFTKCIFENCRMNADAVALSFGLTRSNVGELALVWQGLKQRTPRDVEALLSRLFQAVTERRWGVATASLAVNFGLLDTRDALRLAFGSIDKAFASRRQLRADEVKYLSRLVAVLDAEQALPFLTIVEGLDLCGRAQALEASRGDDSLRALAVSLKEAELHTLQAWEGTRLALGADDDRVLEVEFVFETKPTADLLPVLEEIAGGRDGQADSPRLIAARAGSYIEVMSMALGTLMALVIALGMLTRVVDSLISLRARVGVLVSPRLPTSIRTRALQPLPSTSAGLVREVSTCLSLLAGGHLPATSAGASELVKQLRAIEVLGEQSRPAKAPPSSGEGRRGKKRRTAAG